MCLLEKVFVTLEWKMMNIYFDLYIIEISILKYNLATLNETPANLQKISPIKHYDESKEPNKWTNFIAKHTKKHRPILPSSGKIWFQLHQDT